MTAGLSTVQNSSAAYATIPNQFATAFQTGWVLDQKLDPASATGGFITSVSPASSGARFYSTGDATPFYLIGRVVQAVHGGGAAVVTVGQSSSSSGITTVYLNQFSTGTGLTTSLSTASLASVAASPTIPGATGDGPGFMYLIPSTGSTGGFFWPYLAVSATTGGSVARSDVIRIPNNANITARNAADNADVQLMRLSAVNQLTVDPSGSGTLVIGSATVQVGTNPGTVGTVRLPASTGNVIVQRNAGNSADEQLLPLTYAFSNLAADVSITSTALFDGPSVSLAPGTWYVSGRVGLNTATVANSTVIQWAGRLWDGVSAIKATAEVVPWTTGSANRRGGGIMELTFGAIFQLAASATYKISVWSEMSTGKIAASSTGASNSTDGVASWIAAIRLGQ